MKLKPICRNPRCREELQPWKHPLGLCPACYLALVVGMLLMVAASLLGALLTTMLGLG